MNIYDFILNGKEHVELTSNQIPVYYEILNLLNEKNISIGEAQGICAACMERVFYKGFEQKLID